MALTEKQKRFADEYLIDLNATRAYRAAYSSCKKDEVAAVNGSKLLRNTKVEKYINAELEKIQSAKIADAQEVMEHLTAAMRGEIQEEVVVVEGTGEGCSDARIIRKQISEKDRIKAAELLGKRYSLFTDKMDVSGVEGVVIVNDIPKPD
ncbi:MAG: terminase small subunit [Clostridiales bacterium]|nr:terminase small subunit [Clostridiales bacterium]